MVHNIHYTYNFIQTLQWVAMFASDYIVVKKKVDVIYSSPNFRHENTWDEKRLVLSYSSDPMIARTYHFEHKCNVAPKFSSAIPSSAVEPKHWRTMYCRPFNVGTFRFCWCASVSFLRGRLEAPQFLLVGRRRRWLGNTSLPLQVAGWRPRGWWWSRGSHWGNLNAISVRRFERVTELPL